MKEIEDFCNALEALSQSVLRGWAGEQLISEVWGWNCPSVTRHDLANIPLKMAQDIRESVSKTIPDDLLVLLRDYPRRLAVLSANTVPQFWNGNASLAVTAYLNTLEMMRVAIMPWLLMNSFGDNKSGSTNVLRRIKNLKQEIERIEVERSSLIDRINDINEAHSKADNLQEDLQRLNQSKEALEMGVKVMESLIDKAKKGVDTVDSVTQIIIDKNIEVQKLVENSEEFLKIATTLGLAGAFDKRAIQLSRSMTYWVVGLLIALILGVFLGSSRIDALLRIFSSPQIDFGAAVFNVTVTLLGLGAPIWFAWLATKQIGQRFRLSEDYAFKASVAKAYEGYRREAARIDPQFEARLFESALSRLDEAPLRFVEKDVHGSPMHELLKSEVFKNAAEAVPDLKQRLMEILGKIVDSIFKNKEK